MNKRKLWLAALILSLIPFLLPMVTGLYHMWLESWTLPDWLILYSFIYSPIYALGLLLFALSLYKLLRK